MRSLERKQLLRFAIDKNNHILWDRQRLGASLAPPRNCRLIVMASCEAAYFTAFTQES
jgi:hypothetical protein